jgi:L-ascorbate metabolism protein UlaG (beta-lactamase superfamily)
VVLLSDLALKKNFVCICGDLGRKRFICMIDQIQWLGHGSFIIQGPPLIYINPWRVTRNGAPADVILVSHDHYDQCSLADIEKLRGPETRIIGNERVAQMVEGCTVLRPWQSASVGRACMMTVPAYSPNDSRYPQDEGGLGFVISVNFFDIYYAGDTQIIPEMSRIHPDIAILPIDGQGTLTVSEATEVVKQMVPKWVIPCNWNDSATRLDAQRFAREVGDSAEVVILPLTR